MSQSLLLETDPQFSSDELLKSAARKLQDTPRRQFLAEVCHGLCQGNARRVEKRFGWGRKIIERGIQERLAADRSAAPEPGDNCGKQRSEVANPQLAIDI